MTNLTKRVKTILTFTLIFMLIAGMVPVFSQQTEALTENDLRYAGQNRYDTAFEVAKALHVQMGNGNFDNIVVACGSDFPDALSGGYLTAVKNAPLLLVGTGQEAKVISYVKNNMKKGGTVYLLGGEGVIRKQFESSLKQTGVSVKRLAGKNRFETNLKILKESVKKGDELLVATGASYADSLSGSAVPKGMLLVGNELSDNQKDWLKKAGISKFYILGGESVVSKKVANQLKNYAAVERIGGINRYETSYMIANRFFNKADTITMVCGNNYPDGLSGAPLALGNNSPIILVLEGNYNYAQKFVKEKGASKSITIGGTGAVSNNTIEKVMKNAKAKGKFTFLGYYTDPKNKHIFSGGDVVINEPLYGMILRNDTGKPIYGVGAPLDLMQDKNTSDGGSSYTNTFMVIQPGQCFLSYTTMNENDKGIKYACGNGYVGYFEYEGNMISLDSVEDYNKYIKESTINGNLSIFTIDKKFDLPKTTKGTINYVDSSVKLNDKPNMVTITDMKAYWNKPGFDNKEGVSTTWFRIKMKVGSKPIPLHLSEDGGRFNDGCIAFMDKNGAILGAIEFLAYEDEGIKSLSAGKEIEIYGSSNHIPAGVEYYTIFWPDVINTVPKAKKLGFNVKSE